MNQPIVDLSDARVGFIGLGNMGAAIARGLHRAGVRRIAAVEPRSSVFDRLPVQQVERIRELAASSDVVVLAVKPWLVATVVDELASCSERPAVVVSIAAGIAVAEIERAAPPEGAAFRAMPNLAATVGASVTALYSRTSNPRAWALARALFDSVGTSVVLGREEEMHGFTAVAGSGPAYLATLIEAMADAAVAEGLSRSVAHASAIAMVSGTAALLGSEGWTTSGLKEAVMSPGGTTAEGIDALERLGGRAAVMGAVRAAAKRSRAMAGED